jgi:hypothetical protein
MEACDQRWLSMMGSVFRKCVIGALLTSCESSSYQQAVYADGLRGQKTDGDDHACMDYTCSRR